MKQKAFNIKASKPNIPKIKKANTIISVSDRTNVDLFNVMSPIHESKDFNNE
jgi:hypothetical protein